MKLYENEKIRKELTRKNIIALHHFNEENLSPEQKAMIDKEVNDILNNKQLLNLHKKASSIIEHSKKLKKADAEAFDEVKKVYENTFGKPLNLHGFERMTYIHMDLSGTPEAKKKNMEYIISLTDKDFAAKEFGKIIKRIQSFDFSKTVFNSPEEALNNLEENYEMLNYMFVFADCMNNGKIDFAEETTKHIKDITSVIQNGGYSKTIMQYYGSSVSLTLPEDNTAMAFMAEKYISTNFAAYKDVIDDVVVNKGQTKDTTTTEALTSGVIIPQIKEAYIGSLPKLYANGTVHKDILNYNAKQDNTPISLDKALSELASGKTNITFERKPEAELNRISSDLTNVHVDIKPNENKDYVLKQLNNLPEKYTLMENTFEDLKKFQKNLTEANHFYSNNHQEYNNLMNKLNEFLNKEATSYTIPEFKRNVKDVEKLALDYVAAKTNENKNTVKQKRYDNCKEIYTVTHHFEKTMNSFEAIPVTDPEIINFEKENDDILDMSFSSDEPNKEINLVNE